MSQLTIYDAQHPAQAEQIIMDNNEIAKNLEAVGVSFEQWSAEHRIEENHNQEQILAAYHSSIQALKQKGGYTTADVVSLSSNHPDKALFRAKFLSEHTHSEDEVRFFVKGSGLFCLHIKNKVYAVLCEQGDLISVPAGVPHWFDMGSEPEFTCIRLFINPEGWVADFTGNDIATKIPNMDAVI